MGSQGMRCILPFCSFLRFSSPAFIQSPSPLYVLHYSGDSEFIAVGAVWRGESFPCVEITGSGDRELCILPTQR
jgi:hypothetical protein